MGKCRLFITSHHVFSRAWLWKSDPISLMKEIQDCSCRSERIEKNSFTFAHQLFGHVHEMMVKAGEWSPDARCQVQPISAEHKKRSMSESSNRSTFTRLLNSSTCNGKLFTVNSFHRNSSNQTQGLPDALFRRELISSKKRGIFQQSSG